VTPGAACELSGVGCCDRCGPAAGCDHGRESRHPGSWRWCARSPAWCAPPAPGPSSFPRWQLRRHREGRRRRAGASRRAAPIRASMETVHVGTTATASRCTFDRCAHEADHVLVSARKPHTISAATSRAGS
jgi:hypothetical protein